MARLTLSNVSKEVGAKSILRDINLSIDEGEFVVILGPSGCGKTTLLRMIAGLETVTSGKIVIDGITVNDKPPRTRNVAMVFQNYSLYAHLSVRENLAFGLKARKTPAAETKRRVEEVAEILRISALLGRKPNQLSGGEKQRVAIGRALVRDPKLFLFDEPLSNLDASLRMELRSEIKRLHQRFGSTSIFVTHDQVEAMSMADRLVVMNAGQILQIGRTEDVYFSPQSAFVAGFLGNPGMNLLNATTEIKGDKLVIVIGDSEIKASKLGLDRAGFSLSGGGQKLIVGIRPESISSRKDGDECFTMNAEILVLERLGSETQVVMQNHIGQFRLRTHELFQHRVGDLIPLYLRYNDIHLFDGVSQRRIGDPV